MTAIILSDAEIDDVVYQQLPIGGIFQVWIDLNAGQEPADWWWNSPPQPLRDALAEVAELTDVRTGKLGRTREQLQIAALKTMHIPFHVSAIGRPKVARAIINGGAANWSARPGRRATKPPFARRFQWVKGLIEYTGKRSRKRAAARMDARFLAHLRRLVLYPTELRAGA